MSEWNLANESAAAEGGGDRTPTHGPVARLTVATDGGRGDRRLGLWGRSGAVPTTNMLYSLVNRYYYAINSLLTVIEWCPLVSVNFH